MELAFQTKDLRTLCENELIAQKEFGAQVASKLKSRLSDIRAARTLDEILTNIFFLNEQNDICVIELSKGYHIFATTNHPKNPTLENGKVDWANVSRIKILKIGKKYD